MKMYLLAISLICVALLGAVTGNAPSVVSQYDLPPLENAFWDGREYPEGHGSYGVRVPFFLYSGGGFDAFTKNCNRIHWSKGVEVNWLSRLERHPWRVTDPEEATVFVVPALFSLGIVDTNQLPYEGSTTFNRTLLYCRKTLYDMGDELLAALKGSKYYKRSGGKDHVMVVSYFKAQVFIAQAHHAWRDTVATMTIATHVINNNYLHVPKAIGVPCRVSVGHQTGPSHQFELSPPTQIDRTLFFLGQAAGAGFYHARAMALQDKVFDGVGENNYLVASECGHGENQKGADTFPVCGSPDADKLSSPTIGCCIQKPMAYGEYLHMLKHSNFSLNIKGGDPGSSRTFDAIAVGTPQIIVSDGFIWTYAPFPCTVPWDEFIHQVKQKPFERNTKVVALNTIPLAFPKREAMKKMQDSFKDDMLWTNRNTLAANNLLVQVAKQCLPRYVPDASAAYWRARKIISAHKCKRRYF